MGLIQVRNVPADVHRTLKVRAATEGTSLSDYILREMTRLARTPTPQELDARIRERQPAGVSTKEILDARDAGRRLMRSTDIATSEMLLRLDAEERAMGHDSW